MAIINDDDDARIAPAAPGNADGRSTRWDRHRAERRAELIKATRRAVHKLGPAVSMDEIAAATGTSKSIFYRYFADKSALRQEVAIAVVGDMYEQLVAAAGAARDPMSGLRHMVAGYLELIAQSPNLYWYVSEATGAAGIQVVDAGASIAADAGAGDTGARLARYLDGMVTMVAAPYAELMAGKAGGVDPGAAVDAARAWAAGAIGFVRGSGEWWLARHEAGVSNIAREQLARKLVAWLWQGPAPRGTMVGAVDL